MALIVPVDVPDLPVYSPIPEVPSILTVPVVVTVPLNAAIETAFVPFVETVPVFDVLAVLPLETIPFTSVPFKFTVPEFVVVPESA